MKNKAHKRDENKQKVLQEAMQIIDEYQPFVDAFCEDNCNAYACPNYYKALERARLLKNAIEKDIITDEEHTVAIDDLANGLEQEIEDDYQTITNGLKTWAERTGESVQLILDRLQDMHEELKELEKEDN